MRSSFLAIIASLTLASCQSTQPQPTPAPTAQTPAHDATGAEAPVEQEWKPSTLSEQTIAKANEAVKVYNECLVKETRSNAVKRGDPRDIANSILKTCEGKLSAIKDAFDAEQVPAHISERYMRKTRSHGVQSVMREVMFVHAERAGQEAEPTTKKPKKK